MTKNDIQPIKSLCQSPPKGPYMKCLTNQNTRYVQFTDCMDSKIVIRTFTNPKNTCSTSFCTKRPLKLKVKKLNFKSASDYYSSKVVSLTHLSLAYKDAMVFFAGEISFALNRTIVLTFGLIQRNSNPFTCQQINSNVIN